MHSFIKRLICFSLITLSTSVLAQQRNSLSEPEEEYKLENLYGVSKGTNGGLISGFFYRHSKVINENDLINYGVEIVNIKHIRESKETTITGNSYVFGKANYFVSIRPTYGREKLLFKRAPEQGVRISGLFAVGPALGMELPYFIILSDNSKVQYDPSNTNHASNRIFGSTGPFRGLGQSKFVLGGHARASLTFETNSTKRRVFGVEVGLTLDVYTRKINILPVAENNSIFSAAFIAIYFGRRS